MSVLDFARPRQGRPSSRLPELLNGYSIEVMPSADANIEDLRAHLPVGTRAYDANIDCTYLDEMAVTLSRIADKEFTVKSCVPAGLVSDLVTLNLWLERYARESGTHGTLLSALGSGIPAGISKARSSFWRLVCLIPMALIICMWRDSRKATVKLILTAETGWWTRLRCGGRPFLNALMRTRPWLQNLISMPSQLLSGPIVCRLQA